LGEIYLSGKNRDFFKGKAKKHTFVASPWRAAGREGGKLRRGFNFLWDPEGKKISEEEGKSLGGAKESSI